MDRSLIREYAHLHRTSHYGATAHKSLPYVLPHILALKPCSLVDYGCGQSNLAELLAAKASISTIARFDPALPEFAARPTHVFDVLVNVDVLEHIPEEEIDGVAADMSSMCRHAFLVIDTGPALTLLSDGRNAHVSQHEGQWWLRRLSTHFPHLRPVPIGRPRRVAFKTWDTSLPWFRHKFIEWRERATRHAGRFLRRRGPPRSAIEPVVDGKPPNSPAGQGNSPLTRSFPSCKS
jgi:hypothetical protein